MIRKRLIILFLSFFSLASPSLWAQSDALWEQANQAYTAGNYPQAIMLYDSLENQGYTSAKLYYNLGNACFKDNQPGRAILYYSKAQRRDPGNADIRHNLLIANAQIRDRIESVPEFFLKTWARQAMYRFGSDAWAAWSLLFFGLTLVAVLLYLLDKRLRIRKIGFYGAILCLLLSLGALGFAAIQRRKILHPDGAVVMLSAAPVKTEPNTASRDAFVLHEGTTVRVVGQVAGWHEIVLADGNQGWIESASIALID